MPTDDLIQHATSEHDFYDLLGVTFETSDADIRRAYRRTALKYHPDKNAGNPSAVEKFHLLQIAYDVLTDAAVKAAYDNARAARLAKQRQKEMFDGRRRQMMDDLERRERGVKRGRDEEADAEERLRREVARLAEDGKRRRMEREEMLKREEEERRRGRGSDEMEKLGDGAPDGPGANGVPESIDDVAEINRAVKVRWARHGAGEAIDKDHLASLFSTFGRIEGVCLLKDKKRRMDGKKEKRLIATGVIQFASIVGAHAAVEDFPRKLGAEWQVFDSVFWASNREPDFGFPVTGSVSPPPAPLSQASFVPEQPKRMATPETPKVASPSSGAARPAPSFTSFSSAPRTKQQSSPFATTVAGSPTLEELTMIRLKKAEKKRLEDELRRREEEEERREADESRREGKEQAGAKVVPV